MVISMNDRQGVMITSAGEVRLTTLPDKTSVSANMFSLDQIFFIDSHINESN
jgi:hypothetical protein